MRVEIKRVYDEADRTDGKRVLVDRLWPRGLSKEKAGIDLWLKEIAPSPELRKDWHADPDMHKPEHFPVFEKRYRAELGEGEQAEALGELRKFAKEHEKITLVYGLKDEKLNHARVLREILSDA